SAGANGSISSPGVTTYNCGDDPIYTITVNSCYHVADVKVDNNSVGPVGTYTFTDVAANHTISATFALNTYTINASAGSGGSITDPGASVVSCGDGKSYTIAADPCYHIADVQEDG